MGVTGPSQAHEGSAKRKREPTSLSAKESPISNRRNPESHDARPQAGHGPLRDFELSTNQEASQISKTRADLLVKPVFEEGDQSTQMLHY